ncbi:MAG TPA: hypothetical protein VFI02_14085 [Armatimonadota bacterium]|nr:hypothetical protein [Armatimonadota bacterium]
MTELTQQAVGYDNEVHIGNPRLRERAANQPIFTWVSHFDLGGSQLGNSDIPTPEVHLDLYDIMCQKQRAVIIMPRSFAKSTLFSFNLPMYLAFEHVKLKNNPNRPITPYKRITLISNTGALARQWLKCIKLEVETNPLLLAVYGDLRGDRKRPGVSGDSYVWRQDALDFVHPDGSVVSLRAVGRGYQQRGWRPDLVVADDLDDDEEVRSPERIEIASRWWDRAVTPMLDKKKAACLVVGTVVAENCVLTHIRNKAQTTKRWHTFNYKAYPNGVMEPGAELWPSKWPHHRLQEELEDMGYDNFMAEYMGEPISSEAPIFHRTWFRHYDSLSLGFKRVLREQIALTINVLDLATKKIDGTDYNALVTISATNDVKPKYYIRVGGVKRGHWSINRVALEAFMGYEDFECHAMIIEVNAYQDVMADVIEEYMELNHRTARIERVTTLLDKTVRARAISPIVEAGRVYVDLSQDQETKKFRDPMHVRLVTECVQFQPDVKNLKIDVMDAFVMGMQFMKEWEAGRKSKKKTKRVLPDNARISKHTGIVR